jgi:hypothetical protein
MSLSIASASILMQSKSDNFPDGLGNDSGELGYNIMDHHRAGAFGKYDGFGINYYKGRRPNSIYIHRFRNLKDNGNLGFKRGYGYQGARKQERLD